MTDLICLNCDNYDFQKEYCHKVQAIIPSTDESGALSSCMHRIPIRQTSIKQGDIFWGKDEHNEDRWWLCHICHCWFREKDTHYCTVVIPEEIPFITEKEMEI